MPEPVVSTEIQPHEWDAFVESRPDATGYHLWRWRSIFTGVFGHDCEYFAVREDGHVVGVLPIVVLKSWLFGRFGVSLPFVNYGGVLALNQNAADALVSGATASARARKLAHLELRQSSTPVSDTHRETAQGRGARPCSTAHPG